MFSEVTTNKNRIWKISSSENVGDLIDYFLPIANSLYETHLQGIMGVVFNKTYQRLGNPEYNYHNFLRACLIEGIGHFIFYYEYLLVYIRINLPTLTFR